jgi:antitoxin component of RelBE/YafQ-DinJ toxin-antitoxin module
MTTKTKEISTRVTEDTKASFIKLAENQGLTESELLQLIITRAINNQAPPKAVIEKEMSVEMTALKIYLPKFLIVKVKERARMRGMSATRFIKSLVQSHLIQPPVLIDSAIIAAERSDRELAAVGNNLNQIARKINESAFKIDLVKLETLEEVKQAVKSVRASIDGLIRISHGVWAIHNDQ